MCENDTQDNFKQNKETETYINKLNCSDSSNKNGNEILILLDYRKNLINIPVDIYEPNEPNDVILAYYNRFTLITYIHITIYDKTICIEYIKTNEKYQNKGYCQLLISILIVLSKKIIPNINIIHLDSINYNLSYLCIFTFGAIPQNLYYKDNLYSTNIKEDDIKDDDKIAKFNKELVVIADKTKEEQYKYIKSFDARFGNDLFLIIDIDDSFIDVMQDLINNYI